MPADRVTFNSINLFGYKLPWKGSIENLSPQVSPCFEEVRFD